MARNFAGDGDIGAESDEYFMCGSSGFPQDGPMTMACWWRSNSLTKNHVMIGISDGTDGQFCILANFNSYGDAIVGRYITSSDEAAASTTVIADTTNWHHAAMTVNSLNRAAAFLDGGNKGTDYLNTPIDMTGAYLTIGGRTRSNNSNVDFTPDGDVAVPCIWDAELSDAEIAMLAAGVHPLMIRPESITNFFPLDEKTSGADIRDVVGGLTGTHTVSGTSQSGNIEWVEDPPLYYPQSPIIRLAAAAAPAGTRPQNPLGHPFAGPFAGPIG